MAGMTGKANHLGVGDRPSESHDWVPGIGWVFMPSYAEGESFAEQSAAAGGEGFNIKVSQKSKADAEKAGVTGYYSEKKGGIPREQARAIRERQASHGWYRGGMDHFNPTTPLSGDNADYQDGSNFITEANNYQRELWGENRTSPWFLTTDDARMDTYNAFMEDNYNPFIGNEGAWVTPEGNDLRGSNNGTAEGYRDDSISAYLKHAFSGKDQVKNRGDALRAFKKWNGTERGINTATTKMHQRYFDELGLADFGLEYEGKAPDPVGFVPQDVSGGWNPTGMMTGGKRPFNPIHSNSNGTGITPPDMMGGEVGGSFLAAYKAKRDELANKPSVMSLMTELKDA